MNIILQDFDESIHEEDIFFFNHKNAIFIDKIKKNKKFKKIFNIEATT